jgi:hypothetical protein
MDKASFAILAVLLIGFRVSSLPGEHPSREQQPVYLDPAKPLDDRVDDLLRQMTLAEKISLLGTIVVGSVQSSTAPFTVGQ